MGLLQRIFGARIKYNMPDVDSQEEEIFFNKKNIPPRGAVDIKSFENIDSRQEIISCCERIMAHSATMKDEKNEYDVVTGYLNDTQILDKIPDEDRDEIQSTALKILQYGKQREGFLNQKQRLPEDRINDFDAAADDIPNQINNLRNNEAYQSVVKRDMQYLEGEKASWVADLDRIRDEKVLFNKLLIGIAVVFGIWIVFTLVMKIVMDMDLTIPNIIAFVLVAAAVFGIFIRISSNKRGMVYAEAALNKSIIMQNRMKAKYVSVTNAVDYVYDKYDVHSSYELNYLWDQYLIAVKERKEAALANEQMTHQKRVLVRQLMKFELSDPSIWVNQCRALIDPREMVEVRHRMVTSRQKIRARMLSELEEIKNERRDLDLLLSSGQKVPSEINQVIDAIDRFIAGLDK